MSSQQWGSSLERSSALLWVQHTSSLLDILDEMDNDNESSSATSLSLSFERDSSSSSDDDNQQQHMLVDSIMEAHQMPTSTILHDLELNIKDQTIG